VHPYRAPPEGFYTSFDDLLPTVLLFD